MKKRAAKIGRRIPLAAIATAVFFLLLCSTTALHTSHASCCDHEADAPVTHEFVMGSIESVTKVGIDVAVPVLALFALFGLQLAAAAAVVSLGSYALLLRRKIGSALSFVPEIDLFRQGILHPKTP